MKAPKVEAALVVGAGSGMGRAAALALGQDGIRVLAADLDEAAAREAAEAVATKGGRAEAFCVDVSRPGSVRALFDTLRKSVSRIEMMVHTAAILGSTVLIEEMSDEEWERMIGINLSGTFFCCRETVRWMKETGGGRIVLFSSVASLSPTPGALHYSASKGGVNMLGKTLAREAAPHNIRVNVVAPGYIETPMLDGLPDGFSDYVRKRTPLRRLGEVEEIAALVRFLAGPEADFFTGQVLSPNGGFVI